MIITLPAPPDAIDLEGLIGPAPPLSLREAALLLTNLARDSAFLDVHIYPLLEGARGAEDWYVARSYEARDGSCSLQVFVWPRETGTQIHDHTCWGAYRCAVGSVFEERYERLDDGSRLNHARLKKIWSRAWSREDGVSTVLPFDGGIHRVGSFGGEAAISIHLYGPKIGELDGRDYDPLRDYVCDRMEA